MKALLFGATLGALTQWPAVVSLAADVVSALTPAAVLSVLALSAARRIRRWAR